MPNYANNMNVHNFSLFRYEINSVFKKHQFADDKDSGLLMGRHPLSRAIDGQNKGMQLKNLKLEDQEDYQDRFRPPGIVRIKDIPVTTRPDDVTSTLGSTLGKTKENP